jgi:hypothetical protein
MPTMLAYALSDPPKYPIEAVIIACCITLLETGALAWSLGRPYLRQRLAALSLFAGWAIFWISWGFGVFDAGGLPAAHALWLTLIMVLGGLATLLCGFWVVVYWTWRRYRASQDT